MTGSWDEDRAVEAFQEAAGEVIAAARTMLDVAEDLVADPRTARTVAGVVGTVGRVARCDGSPAGDRRRPGHDGDGPEPGTGTGSGPDSGEDGVRRIPVS